MNVKEFLEKNNLNFFIEPKLKIFSLAFFIIVFFNACEDKSYFKQIYNKKLYSEPIECLQLELSPFSQKLYDSVSQLYSFDNRCNRTLQIRYKTDIGCNSPYSTNRSFHSFIELNLIKNNKTYYTLYKDLKDEDIDDEIKKAFELLQSNTTFN